MNPVDIAARRLGSSRLRGPAFTSAPEAVGWFGAVQSQEYGPATWSLGQRTADVDVVAVERAFAEGAILRTHLLRPTWHFVLPADIGWLLALTAPRVHAMNGPYYRKLELDPEVFRRSAAALDAALRGGNHLTRPQVAAVLAAAGVEASGMRLGYALMHAELSGLICSGAPAGRQHTYALLAERAPGPSRLGRPDSLRELVVRYFTSHGPATAKDLRWWSSLTLADIRQGIELAGPRLRRELIDGVSYFSAPTAPTAPTGPASSAGPRVDLVQGYDEYVVAFSESRHVHNLAGLGSAESAGRALPVHAVLLDGQLAGHWRRTVGRAEVAIEAHLYAPFDRARTRALDEAAARHGDFLGRRAVLTTTLIG